MLQVRSSIAKDQPSIWNILRPIFRAGDTYAIDPNITESDAIAYWMQSRSYIAEIDGETLGTYYLRPNQQGGGEHVCNCGFATHLDARSKGIASAMLDHSLTEAKKAGYRAMQFNFVLETNQGALRLWHRAGFVEVGRLPGVFLHPSKGYVDALILHKHLVDL